MVCVSSTSVHSLLRKAGTLELCFIVSQARGFRILLPNAKVASQLRLRRRRRRRRRRQRRRRRRRRRQQLLPGTAHRAGAAAPGLRPLGRRGGARGGGESPRPHVMDRASGSTQALGSRAGPLRVQSQSAGAARSKAIGCRRQEGWVPEGFRLLFYLLGRVFSARNRGGDQGNLVWRIHVESVWVRGLWLAEGRNAQGPLTHKSGRRRLICSSLKEEINHMAHMG